jgi:hypothetical protein
MKSKRKHASLSVTVLALGGLLLLAVPGLLAQQDQPPTGGDADDTFNPRPCDFGDTFYGDNGIDVTQLDLAVAGRFGNFRQFGPPARQAKQANWVTDSTCARFDPDRRNVRILATTGGYPDDGSGRANEFISLIGFLTNQIDFEATYSRTVGTINGGLDGDQQNSGETISIVNSQNPRGISMQSIIGNFEAYAAQKQRIPAGQPFAGSLAPTPCGVNFDPNVPVGTPCFPVAVADANGVSANVATPNLRQDWRFATNRNAMDGSDNNCLSNDPTVCPGGFSDSPFGYFCDDLLGAWIITYFWNSHHAVGNPLTGEQPDQVQCVPMLNQLAKMHGKNLDGTPVLLTANELNFLEGKNVGATPLGPNFPNPPSFPDGEGCMQEGKEDPGGADAPAAVWLICPAIPDPRAGAIAVDAFLDTVRFPSGVPVDLRFNLNFACLQAFGVFCNEIKLTSSQLQKVQAMAAKN